jgi:effector protein SdbA
MASLQQDNQYYSLHHTQNEKRSAWSYLLMPTLLPRWLFSFLLARVVSNFVLNTTNVKRQEPVHYISLSDTQDGLQAVVINLLPHERNKLFHDFFLKFNHNVLSLLFINTPQKRKLYYRKKSDKAHVDRMLQEAEKLINGESKASKCVGKTFRWEEIHFKGIECLDASLRHYFFHCLQKKYGDALFNQSEPQFNFFTLQTADGAVLDSVEVSCKGENEKPLSDRKFVIACLPRDQNYISWLKDFRYSAQNIDCTVIGFNYRGVCYSRGLLWTQDNAVNDAVSQVKRLLLMGVKPQNICLEGHCIGGAIATLAASQLHAERLRVKLFNERSFRSLPRLLAGYIFPNPQSNLWHPLTWLRYVIGTIVYVLMVPMLWAADWQMDAAHAWNKIPQSDKGFLVAQDHTNPEVHEDDGIVHSWASIASVVDENKSTIAAKQQAGKPLTAQEKAVAMDPDEVHQFKMNPAINHRNKVPHLTPRRHLIQTHEQQAPLTGHDYIVKRIKEMFGSTSLRSDKHCEPKLNPHLKNPLILASSGGTGHITAAMGIIDDMQQSEQDVHIPLHQAHRYEEKNRSKLGLLIQLGVYLMSIQYIGKAIKYITNQAGYPSMPRHDEFWQEINKLNQAETDSNSEKQASNERLGRQRPYTDILLDICPAGYESIALYNTHHRNDQTKDLQLILKHQASSDRRYYQAVYAHILKMLKRALDKGEPYSEVISTQILSLNAICDAVACYNKYWLPKANKKHDTAYPPIEIHQYLTDLAAPDAKHFLYPLMRLTPIQQQQFHIHAVNMSPGVKFAYLNNGRGFKGIHDICPEKNPMVRAGFKNEALVAYTDTTQNHCVEIKTYPPAPHDWKTIHIDANEKVASVMLGSQAATATVDYVRALLKTGYDKIFVFGGLSPNIYPILDQIINEYPEERRAVIQQRIIRLGNQSDKAIGPIMSRSDCVVIRGGGLCIMEQMALPLPTNKKKIFLLHHTDAKGKQPLSTGIQWEDGNTENFIQYMKKQGIYARKSSPKRACKDLRDAHYYLDKAGEIKVSVESISASNANSIRPTPMTHKKAQPAYRARKEVDTTTANLWSSLFAQHPHDTYESMDITRNRADSFRSVTSN